MTAAGAHVAPAGEYRDAVDVIYLAACARDARLTRICVASIRYFYPDVPIRILAGDILQPGLAEELNRYWDVGVADLPTGDYGWGLVKLEPLFGPAGQRFMVCDVDTVFTGRVLDRRAESRAPFYVDNEALSDADFKRLYYDWEALAEIDADVQSARKAFNAGEWFGTAGLVARDDFDDWVEWTLPRRLYYQEHFMGGDQGVMNFVVLKKEAFDGLRIDRVELMRWPGHGLEDLEVERVKTGTAPALVIHWAGMKSIFLHDMVGGDLLQFFEDYYYTRLPAGRLRRRLALCRHIWIHWSYRASVPIRLRWRRIRDRIAPKKATPVLVKQSIGS
ncbi:hypothetical protein ACFOHM_20000 [Microbaculum marinum]